MANEVSIGNLVIRIIGDAKSLEKELKAANAGLQKFDKDAKTSLGNATKAGEAAGKAFAGLVTRLAALAAAYVGVGAAVRAFNSAIDNVTAIDNLSQTTGISIERLSQLRGVALQLGIDFNVLSQATSQFGARMTEALASSTSKGSQAIRALGIDVRDASGNIRQLDELLPELADAFSQFADGSNKAALAAALFGEEAGPRLIPLLNRGSAGLDEIRRRLGLTVTREDAERVRQYREAVARLQIAFDGLATTLAGLASGPAAQFTNFMADNIDEINRFIVAWREFDPRLTEASRAFDNARAALDAMLVSQRRLTDLGVSATAGPMALRLEFDRLTRAITAQQAVVDAAGNAWSRLFTMMTQGQRWRGLIDATANVPATQAPAMDQFALERAQIVYQQMLERLTGTRSIFDEINFSWQEHANVVAQAIAQIDKTQDQAHRRQAARYAFERQLQLRVQEQWMQTASTAAQTIQALWPKQKGAAIAAAIINTSVGVMRAFASMNPPMSFITAALIAAQGAAQIATISSTNSDGTGGSGAAPVAPAPAEGAPMGRSLSISGIDPSSIFSGGQVRGLIDMINEEVRNGATLISTGGLTS